MITTLLLYFYLAILNGFLAVLPEASPLPQGLTDAFAWIQSVIDLMGWMLPFDTLLQIVGLVLGMELTIFGIKWSVWLYNKIRGSG